MAPPQAAPEVAGGGAGIRVENCYVFKSRLQEYTQKAGLPNPEYHTLKEGPSHEPIFSSTVVVNNVRYDSLQPGFFNRKAAEQSAAEVALMEIAMSVPTNASIPAVQETGLCKNLLQEYAQKMNYAIPSYNCTCTKGALGVAPFICTVEIGGIQYIGAAARTKKDAEIKAARTALLAIQGQSEGCANGVTKYIVIPSKRQVKEAEKRPIETPKSLRVKKGGFKKWNKRKFMKKNCQPVTVEMDEARVAGDVNDSDIPMQPTTITQEPSSDSIVLLPGEETSRAELEPSRDTAIVQPNEEARNVKQEQLSENAMPQLNGEARTVETDSMSKPAVPQPNWEARSMNAEPPVMQCDEDAKTVSQEQPAKEPMVDTSQAMYENKNEISELASLETNKSFENIPVIESDPSSTAMGEQ